MPRTMLGMDWEQVIPPKELRKIRELEEEYERLSKKIDNAYTTGRFGRVEDIEQRAAEIEEKLFGLYDVYIFGPEGPHPELEEREVSLEEDLVSAYLYPPDYWTFEEQIHALQSIVRTHLLKAGKDVQPTPEQVLEIAQDVSYRWMEIREGYLRSD